jgi:hypothetical protein
VAFVAISELASTRKTALIYSVRFDGIVSGLRLLADPQDETLSSDFDFLAVLLPMDLLPSLELTEDPTSANLTLPQDTPKRHRSRSTSQLDPSSEDV